MYLPLTARNASFSFRTKLESTMLKNTNIARKSGVGLLRLSELPQTAIRWRWPQRIPTGMVTVVAGYQKTGKSLVACDIAATITRGGSFPAGEGTAKRGHVIIVNNEDDPRQMLGPRLAAADADLNRVHVPNSRWILNRTNLIEKLESRNQEDPTPAYADPRSDNECALHQPQQCG